MSRPRKSIANLHRDGWENAAREVYRNVRGWGSTMVLYAKPCGALIAAATTSPSQFHPAGGELIGTYTNEAQANEIEDDLIEYLRELTGRALEKAA